MSGEKYKPPKSFDEAYKDFLEKEAKTTPNLEHKQEAFITKTQSITSTSEHVDNKLTLSEIAKLSLFTSLLSLTIGYSAAKLLLDNPNNNPPLKLDYPKVKKVF
jgi:predicted nucleic acid-binding protein